MPLSNPISEPQIPSPIARDTEVTAALNGHLGAEHPHPQYLLTNPLFLEFGQGDFNFLDFHTGLPAKDFDVRIMASGGGATNGLGQLLVQAGSCLLNAKVSINGGAQLSKLLSVIINIDLPAVSAGAVFEVTITVSTAAVGDAAFFIPTEMPAGLQFFKIMAVASAGVTKIYFHNLFSGTIDVPAFSGRLLILGF